MLTAWFCALLVRNNCLKLIWWSVILSAEHLGSPLSFPTPIHSLSPIDSHCMRGLGEKGSISGSYFSLTSTYIRIFLLSSGILIQGLIKLNLAFHQDTVLLSQTLAAKLCEDICSVCSWKTEYG